MCQHEEKICPRCTKRFECKSGSITQCQCSGIKLSNEEKAFIEDCYGDCLCRNCLLELKSRYVFFKEKFLFK